MASIEIAEGVRGIPPEEWNRLVADESPFLEWEWLASLEEAGPVGPERGWAARPLVVRQDGRLTAACPLYVKGHSEGEFVFDWSWADAAERAGIRYYPKLLVGVPFTPVTGARLLAAADSDRPGATRDLAQALRTLCDENALSGVHVNFCRREELETLCAGGFLARVGFQYHWRNRGYRDFQDYLDGFRSKRRNQIRRERSELERQGVAIEVLSGEEIPDRLFEAMFRFYRRTVDENPWGRAYLNRRFFELLRERFRHRIRFLLARRNGNPIAGTLNVHKGDALYGRYWGADRTLRYLHFNVCYYAAVEHCIERGIARFEPGAGGEYKQARGFDAEPTFSAHYLRDRRLAAAVARYLREERADAERAITWYRTHGALKAG